MTKKPLNSSLHAAKATKQDEFYTQLSDIEKELRHYTNHFKDKTVLCNCDDPRISNFFHYFSHNFEKLKLKRLITTCYKNQDSDLFSTHKAEQGVYLEYFGDKDGNRVPDPGEIGVHPFKGDGDFRSEECIALLKQADIVVTNPPFSLFREYVQQLVDYGKNFLIIGNHNAITYKEVFAMLILILFQDELYYAFLSRCHENALSIRFSLIKPKKSPTTPSALTPFAYASLFCFPRGSELRWNKSHPSLA